MKNSHFFFFLFAQLLWFCQSQAIAVVGAGCAFAPSMQREKAMSAKEEQRRRAILTSCDAHELSDVLNFL